MKTAIYAGSFNPWHEGHTDVLKKALNVFDYILIAQGVNPAKEFKNLDVNSLPDDIAHDKRITVTQYEGLLVDYIRTINTPINAVIKGLRNNQDMEYERVQQYYNEDLGMQIPTVYFICNRELIHISSSAIRMLEKFK